MILAFILFLGAVSVSPGLGHAASAEPARVQAQPADQQSADAQKPENSPSAPSGSSSQGTPGTTKSANSEKSSSTQGQTAKKPGKRKKKSTGNCNASAQSSPSKGGETNHVADGSEKSASTVSSACPPSKVIVRQGSTSDPNIELVGGAAGRQASDERNTAIQMLQTTEVNLKKMDGAPLDANQQDMIKQVRQFMDQSKAATSAGDLDQARTLAWKAQMLSEELLKAQK